ncbi:MAG TPA: DMT family transporter [Thermoanaerobaculia bacterium]|nr:DMT family transporter [Thermoanaerobaculia bacterium]
MAKRDLTPRIAALAAVILWGISFVATRAALIEISPVTLVFTRFALGTALLFALLAARRRLDAPPRDSWRALVSMGFLGVFVHQMLQAHGLELTTAVHTGWLIGLIPIWSAILGALVLHERLGVRNVAGLVLGFAGAALVITRGEPSAGFLALPATRGDFLILASTVNWAVYSVVGRRTLARLGSARATAFAMLAGWAMLAPVFALRAGWKEYAGISRGGWAAVLFLGIGCSGLGYLFWYTALEKLETSRVAAFLYLEPLVTLAAAVALLGEPVHATTIAGGLIVLAGVFLVQRVRSPLATSGVRSPLATSLEHGRGSDANARP